MGWSATPSKRSELVKIDNFLREDLLKFHNFSVIHATFDLFQLLFPLILLIRGRFLVFC